MNSRIYDGYVMHRRHVPRLHAFRYRMGLLFLDLGELDDVFAHRRFWSVDKRNLGSFRRDDYLGDPSKPLLQTVKEFVFREMGTSIDRVCLLTHARYFGHNFNPVSFYYCYRADVLTAIIAEITNTPWGERHPYLLQVGDETAVRSSAARFEFDKTFHISPFNPMEQRYIWELSDPSERLSVQMRNLENERTVFEARMSLRARPISELNRLLWRFPAATVQVLGAIYWQALRLKLKGCPTYGHPGGTQEDAPGNTPGDVHPSEGVGPTEQHRGLHRRAVADSAHHESPQVL